MSLRIVFVFAIILMAISIASADSVSLPMKTVKKPASDLLSQSGQPLDVGQATVLAKKGQDLSTLSPADNKMWQNATYPAVDTQSINYPQDSVKFLSEEAALPFTYMSRVQSADDPNLFFRFSLSRLTHTALMRAALLRKLGYFIPSPKYYRNLKVYFDSEEQKETFLKNAQESMISDFDSRGWILKNDKVNHTVVFADAVLEPSSNDYFDLHWGYAPDPNNPDQLATVQRLSRYRAYRALIIPFALVDLPESVNRFSPKFASILSGHVVVNHPSAQSFASCGYDDAKWLVRKLGDLRRSDYEDIVRAGAFPKELEELITAKLLYRVNNAFEVFDVKSSSLGSLPSLNINSSSGLVRDGKVTKEMVSGYPQRFAHGDRESPFQDGDLLRYFGIAGRSMALSTALNQLNKHLEILSVNDVYNDRRMQLQDRINKHIREKPFEPLYQDVEAWGGPVAGFDVSATRNVTTGTYYGSSAPIQLVDNMSLGVKLGYFMGLDGVPNVTPFGGGNINLVRSYTHVRPLLSIKEGTKVAWKDVVIPGFMKSLAKILDKDTVSKNAEGVETKKAAVDAFLAELREGEVFTITDSVSLSVYAQVAASMDILMGITPLSFINSVALGADGSMVILRQTSIMRSADGIHVYVRAQNGKVLGMSVDVNFFINILRTRASTSWTDLHTDAFIIDYNPEYSEMIDSGQADKQFVKNFLDTRSKLKPVLSALFRDNDTELLYSKFKYKQFKIDHKLKTKELNSKFLAWKVSRFNEDHSVKILYPRSPEAPELNPKDEQIVLFGNKRGELVGRDLLGFAYDWVEGIINKVWPKSLVDLNRADDPNPANTPWGKAYWRTVNTEVDLTPVESPYPSVSQIQHIWGGWHLNRKDFLRLLDEVQDQFRGTRLGRYRLIEPEAFHNVSSVDFYRITANLSVLPGGLEKVRDLIIQPDVSRTPPRTNAINQFFRNLSKKLGGKVSPNEKELFKDLMVIMGNGNASAGEKKYMNECLRYEQSRPQMLDKKKNVPGKSRSGYDYECLMPWVERLMTLSTEYPRRDKKAQTRWMSEVLYILDEQLPLPQILKLLGEDNYIFVIRINGFRAGDEDGDLEYFSNTLGDPSSNLEYANGLINMFANKTRISPIELDRSQAGFR